MVWGGLRWKRLHRECNEILWNRKLWQVQGKQKTATKAMLVHYSANTTTRSLPELTVPTKTTGNEDILECPEGFVKTTRG